MFVGRGHSVTTTGRIDVPCRCASCGVEWTLRLRATGVGYAVAPYFIGSERARRDAATSAGHDSVTTAQQALQFIACQACGKPIAGRRRHWLVRLLPAIAILFGASIVWGFIGSLDDTKASPMRSMLGAAAIMSALLIGSRARERARAMAAAGTPEWFRGEPPDKPYVGVDCSMCHATIAAVEVGTRCPECGAATHTEDCAREHTLDAHMPDEQGVYRRPRRRG